MGRDAIDQTGASTQSFLAGGGEMGERIRSYDWASTPLGPPETWPQSLKTSIRIMLMSRQPVWIGWGADLIYFYNDPYFSIIGGKHPHALGKPTREVWHEIWDVIAPMLQTAMSGDEGTYVESQLLIMERNGYPEETYYTFSYSPIPDDQGRPGGIFCANSDDTQRVIGQRELALLRELAARTAKSASAEEACARSVEALATNPLDLPFAAVYLLGDNGTARLQGTSLIDAGHPVAPLEIALDDPLFRFSEALESKRPVLLEESRLPRQIPTGGWSTPPRGVLAIPLTLAGEGVGGGVLLAGLNPFRLLDDGYMGFLGLVAGQIGAAISDAEAIQRDRERLRAMAELDRAKTTFFANISHEFRTPLTLMLGPLNDLLSEDHGHLPEQVRLELETARRNGLRLQKLVNALLDFSRLEAGRMKAMFRPVDLAAFTAELASSFQSAVERVGLRLIVDCPPLPADRCPYVDPELWEKVVLNLLSNAFKHTFEGSIAVSTRLEGGAVLVDVRDTGVGISSENLPRLFERFRRVEGAKSRTHEGSGIGLALVQEIVRLHGGTIEAWSSVEASDHGTRFRISLPLGKAHLPPDQVQDEPAREMRPQQGLEIEAQWLAESDAETVTSGGLPTSAPVRAKGARVLIVDDNPDMRGYIARLLGRHYRLELAADGQEALDLIHAELPDLLITDVMMPRLDGFELVRRLRSNPTTAELPIIMLSARAGEEATIEGLDAGADDYLVKPFSARELLARADSALALANLRKEALRAIRQSEERAHLALDAARMIAWELEPDTDRLRHSENATELLGAPEGIPTFEAFLELVHPDDREEHRRLVTRALAERQPFNTSYRTIRPGDGSALWWEERGTVRETEDGLRLVAVSLDVTERVQAERERADAQALLAAEKRVLEAITKGDALPDVLALLMTETERLSHDGMRCSVLLLDESGERLHHGAAPSLPEAYNRAIHGIAIGAGVGSCGTAAFTKRPVYVQDIERDPLWSDFRDLALAHGLRACSSIPVFSSQGQCLGTVAMYYLRPQLPSPHDQELTDRAARLAGLVIERNRALATVEAERARLKDFFLNVPAVVAILRGPSHVFELVNRPYAKLVGRSDPSELVGLTVKEALPEIESQGFIDILDRTFQSGTPYVGNEALVRLDREGTGQFTDVYVNFIYQPFKNLDGETEGIIAHAVDVTELVNARRKVEELARDLEAKVQQRTSELVSANEQLQGFTYSVAHDLRQQIRSISINASSILEDARESLELESRMQLERMVTAAKNLAVLVDDLLKHAKLSREQPRMSRVDLSEIARGITREIAQREMCSERTRFVVEDTPMARCDESMLRLVLQNLLENACKFAREEEAPLVEFGHDQQGFYVKDNGIGFDMRYAHKLFQPFERLHSGSEYEGTGIGLANVRRIIEKHRGRVWADSAPGEGATFRFTLPAPGDDESEGSATANPADIALQYASDS